ncbi:olfactomedin-like protein 3 isoform X3 [Nerophis ophidion]|uniref:olfactomedin-like protein 3 isoform X3 n=1 Tax=Nerophis ophidion TaxID=159077 RepID=UPI002AE0485E|nr:olfactomedin-like protein 3 isoform X3 [Nerophis ophidion]
MSGREFLVLVLLLCLCLNGSSVKSQGFPQDGFLIQYLERRLTQMEERLNQCEQNTVSITQKTYDLSSGMRGHLSALNVMRSEVKNQLESMSVRVDRMERELEYLENKMPALSDIEMEEALIEQQIKAAELDQLKKKAKIQVENDCNAALSQIKSLKIVKKMGDTSGSWFKDPSDGSNKVDLSNASVVDSTLLPGAGRLPVYSLNSNTYLDMAVDELGLWVIHADPEYGGNLVLTKLDKGNLAVEYIWDTQCKSHDAEGAFIICGTLYVVFNTHYGGRSTVQCLYDIHDTTHSAESPVVFFPKRYTSHSSIHYHPRDNQLYAWDDGYQTIYQVEMHSNDQVTAG